MAIAPIRIDNSGNQILRQIIAGQNVTLRDVLAKGVQGNRDLLNNQANQEAAFLNERRFNRNFREQQLRDRRDYARGVETSDREFGEGIRQFNVLDSDRDAARNLSAELGRGNLGVARGGLELRKKESEQKLAIGDVNLQRGKSLLEREEESKKELSLFRERERIANNPDLYANQFAEGTPKSVIEEQRSIELSQLARDAQYLNLRDISQLNKGASDAVADTVYVETPRDVEARGVFERAQEIAATDPQGASELLNAAVSLAGADSPVTAQVQAYAENLNAEIGLSMEGSSVSTKAGESAVEIYESGRSRFFDGNKSTLKKERDSARSLTRSEYINMPPANDENDQDPLSDAQKDARRKERAKFWDSSRATSDADFDKATAQHSSGDSIKQYLDEDE